MRAILLTADPAPRDTPDGLWRVVSFGFQNDPGHLLLVAQSEDERVEARAEAASYTLIATLLMGLLVTLLLKTALELRHADQLAATHRH